MLVGYLGTKETKGDSCTNKEKCCRVVYHCGSVIKFHGSAELMQQVHMLYGTLVSLRDF